METYRDNNFDDTQSNIQSVDHSRLNQRIAIIGAPFVGKTSIYSQLMNKGFQEHTDQGTYEESEIDVEINGGVFTFQLVDVPDNNNNYTSFLKDCMGYFIVFSLNDELSFKRMQEMYHDIIKRNGRQMKSKIIVIGNKRDLPKQERNVKGKEIKKFYKDNKQEYIKLCAKDKKSIDGMFKKLIENIFSDNAYLSKSNILTNSIAGNNPYASQTITQTGVSRNNHNQRFSVHSSQNDNYYCDNNCKKCTIF